MASPTGIIPEDEMYPKAVGQVMQRLKNLPIPGIVKREILLGWARTVGVKLSPSQYAAVERTGTDHINPQG